MSIAYLPATAGFTRKTAPDAPFVMTVAMKLRVAFAPVLTLAAILFALPVVALAQVINPDETSSGVGSVSVRTAPGLKTPIVSNGSWTVYHHDNAHTGADLTQNPATHVKGGWTSPTLDERVFGSPLIYGGLVFVATLNNTVYALNQIDGSVVWSNHLRNPETGGWSCGNVSPQGILGTGVIDPSTGRIFVTTLEILDDHYRLEGLNLATGVEEVNTDISAFIGGAFDWTIQQQRGALAVANGYVYVPFGGRAGDCGSYHGWVFAVPTSGAAITHYYVTPGNGAGFWAAGGVVVNDSTGKVFVTSGNGTGSGCTANPDGTPAFENDAVVRLSAILAHEDSFVPFDWQANWCSNDQDLGSTSPLLISPNLLFQSGKWGTGFLLNPASLGGMGHQLFPAPLPAPYSEVDTCHGNHSDATFGSYAYAAPFVYLECEGRGLVALNVDTGAPSFGACSTSCPLPDWSAGSGITFGPPIVAGGLVWAANNGGGLYAYRADTGMQVFHSAGFGIERFVTPAEAGGQVFVPAGTVIKQFVMGFDTAQSSPPPPPLRTVPVQQTGAPAPGSRQPANQSSPAPSPFGR